MDIKVGDKVSWLGDLGIVRETGVYADWPYLIELDEGGTLFANDNELEVVS